MFDVLRQKVGPLGIRVMVVEPEAFRTDFAGRSLQHSNAVIADYARTAGPRCRTLIKLVERSEPPFRIPLGSDAVTIVAAELDTQRQEIDVWKEVSVSTDFPANK